MTNGCQTRQKETYMRCTCTHEVSHTSNSCASTTHLSEMKSCFDCDTCPFLIGTQWSRLVWISGDQIRFSVLVVTRGQSGCDLGFWLVGSSRFLRLRCVSLPDVDAPLLLLLDTCLLRRVTHYSASCWMLVHSSTLAWILLNKVLLL